MARCKSREQNFRKYLGCGVSFHIDEKDLQTQQNLNNLVVMTEALQRVGVTMDISNGRLELKLDSDNYNRMGLRYAGPKDKKYVFQTSNYGVKGDIATYADVIEMMKTMTDKEIMEELDMLYASYYRHKKAMLESDEYSTYLDSKDEKPEFADMQIMLEAF